MKPVASTTCKPLPKVDIFLQPALSYHHFYRIHFSIDVIFGVDCGARFNHHAVGLRRLKPKVG